MERKRSRDGRKEAREIAEAADAGHQGRSGGRVARQVGTEDELRRTSERPAGVTRDGMSDEKPDDNADRSG